MGQTQAVAVPDPTRDEHPSVTWKLQFKEDGPAVYLTAVLNEDDTLRKISMILERTHPTLPGLFSVIAGMTNLALAKGSTVEEATDVMLYTQFEPCGYTISSEIREALSLTDYIGKWLRLKFCGGIPDAPSDVTSPMMSNLSNAEIDALITELEKSKR